MQLIGYRGVLLVIQLLVAMCFASLEADPQRLESRDLAHFATSGVRDPHHPLWDVKPWEWELPPHCDQYTKPPKEQKVATGPPALHRNSKRRSRKVRDGFGGI